MPLATLGQPSRATLTDTLLNEVLTDARVREAISQIAVEAIGANMLLALIQLQEMIAAQQPPQPPTEQN